jgi:hypothetical protein
VKSQARLRLRKPPPREDIMPKVNGKPWRCRCGGNVCHIETWKMPIPSGSTLMASFQTVYVCNACGQGYAPLGKGSP